MKSFLRGAARALAGYALLWAAGSALEAQPAPAASAPAQFSSRSHLGDYDSELRRADGRVDVDGLANRLQELGVTTYYWLVWHAPTDWDDLKLFLPKARQANIDVWVYLVPPTEGSGTAGPPSQPFGLDFLRWAEEIARLSLAQTNLTGWVIDDFYANHQVLNPDYVGQMQSRAKAINPHLVFLPLMYYDELHQPFIQAYRPVIDGVVVAYLRDRDEIDRAWALLNDASLPPASEMAFPANTPSYTGAFALASQRVKVVPGDRYVVRFSERDNFTGPTSGYHFKQLLVDTRVVWEEDVAGGPVDWRPVSVDVTKAVRGLTNFSHGFRLWDKKGVSNFGVRWQLRDLQAENLQLSTDFTAPQQWQPQHRGAFELGFGRQMHPGQRRFHIPFISMTAGDVGEFRLRHGEPASPERIAEWLKVSLQAWKDGRCDGVVTYCLDKSAQSQTFPLARKLFHEFGSKSPGKGADAAR